MAETTGSTVVLFGAPDGTGSMKMMYNYVSAMARAGYRIALVHGDSIRGGAEPIPSAGRVLLDDLASLGVELVESTSFRGGSAGLLSELRTICLDRKAESILAFHQTDRAPAVLVSKSISDLSAVLCIQNLHTFHGSAKVKLLKERVYRLIAGRADLLIASSPAVESELLTRFSVSPERVEVISNSIDVAGYPEPSEGARARIRSELGVGDTDVLLLNVARLDPQKGHEVLIEALEMAQLDGVLVAVAGGASAGSTTDDFVERLRTRLSQGAASESMTLLGWRDDIRDLFEACDIYVHPSIWEGWPLAALEAMAASRPVILSDCVGRPEGFVDGVHGEVVPVSDPEALSAAIKRTVGRPASDWQEMGAAARALALAHYDIAAAAKKFIASVESVT